MFVGWREVRFARGRFALMGGVIVLITMLVGLLSGLTGGLGKESTSAVTGLSADHLVFSAGANTFESSSVSEQDGRRWAGQPGVVVAEPIGISPARATAGGQTAAVTLFGIVPGGQVSGLKTEVAPGEVVLSEAAAEELSVTAGGAISLGRGHFEVRSVEGEASFSHTPVVWTDVRDWRRLASAGPGEATVLALRTDGSWQPGEGTPGQARSISESLSAIGSYTAENGSLQLIRGFLFAISAVVVGAFFTVWTIQRSGDVAVLKALGASDGYLLRDALGQALVLLVGGTVLGSTLATVTGALAQGTVPFVLDPATIGLPVLGMVLLGLAGAALSIARITSVDPLTALGSAR